MLRSCSDYQQHFIYGGELSGLGSRHPLRPNHQQWLSITVIGYDYPSAYCDLASYPYETICERQLVLNKSSLEVVGPAYQGTARMTVTQTCILAWAILGLVVIGILLRVGGRRDERGREVSD